ncbi:FAD-dependent oxidoreductase [Streptomyces sp. NBC_01498]|uniref:NAD(P)/FAD-dependent oxidoreductase n=1 Tax=Streptomyces sp. NBC_01498 TaxID=2975870 RepID=UPI002E7B1BDD|nr:FAD-dependent oxidoreductase [Streptomyces sp. NBC_01498]WTL25371.1 FAD-dependent oxidoreductase [Streptomyces sp. NBC_01498]
MVGAGYAGLMCALRLAPYAHVTLVDPADRFTERVRLHERASGRPDVTHALAPWLRPAGITHVAARATAIDTGAREVRTDDGRTLPYDRLVHALGSRTRTTGDHERAYTVESAAELHKRLRDTPGSLTVVGGGLTGIELAAELGETHPHWRVGLLTEGVVGPGLSERGRAHVRAALTTRGVRLEEGRRATGPDDIDADVVVWAASMTPNSEVARAAGIALDARGRVEVDAALRSVSHPEVYAVGDSAAGHTATAGPLRMGCAAALPSGSQAAGAIVADLRGEEPKPLNFSYSIQCLSLGRRDGLVQFVRADDSPRDRVLTGRPAAYVKEGIVRGTVGVLKQASRRPGLISHIPGFA